MQRLAVVQGLVYMTTNFSTSTTLSYALLELGTLKAAGSSFGLPTNKMERFWWGGDPQLQFSGSPLVQTRGEIIKLRLSHKAGAVLPHPFHTPPVQRRPGPQAPGVHPYPCG